MNCYLVVGVALTDSEIEAAMGENFVRVREGAWVVGTHLLTSADVAERLGMNRMRAQSGIVVRVGEYFGFYKTALWDKIEAWKAL